MSKRISRASFIAASFAGAVGVCGLKLSYDKAAAGKKIPWRLLGPSREIGHRLKGLPGFGNSVSKFDLEKKLLIVGAGIAGLSAAWRLKKKGFDDFVILELEKEAGGNSAWGSNNISAFPWGAHYVPLANAESELVRELFEELDIISGYKDKLPLYNELYLCHEPQERLFKDGRFQEGLVPKLGLQEFESEELKRFFSIVSELRLRKGKDGKPAFAIPLNLSSSDPDLRALDQISMSKWLQKNNFRSRPLRWYIEYCCRDDYGSGPENVSAWAGLHYFAGRRGQAANAESNTVVTWPEGNGFLVQKLKEKLKGHLLCSHLVSSINPADTVEFTYFDLDANKEKRGRCNYLLFAAPRFLARHMIAGYDKDSKVDGKELVYAPWLVANISLKSIPEGKGEALSWDNVSYYSRSLGYVLANHQNISSRQGSYVITYYFPLSENDPALERRQLFEAKGQQLLEMLLPDLEKMHPGITSEILAVDFWTWGHGMIRPSVGFMWGKTRKQMSENLGRVYFAHSDMSGISNFEEAQYQGVSAADRILKELSS